MEDRQQKLRGMRICRFCLTEKDPLTNIYDTDNNKNATPLPLQIMACVTLEVFANDGMPQLICDDCRLQTRKSYAFKSMCKRSDDSLKSYLITGILKRQEKDDILKPKQAAKRNNDAVFQSTVSEQKRIKIENTVETDVDIMNLNQGKDFLGINSEEEKEQGEENISSKLVSTQCFSCDHCERSFPLLQLLQIHERQHTRERKFPCFDCGKKFFSKHDLSKHILTHSSEKPFSCVVCNKSFARASLLHRHEKVHVTVKKYFCMLCDKSYLTTEDLELHMESHNRKRPFKCRQCDKCFSFKQGLERHRLSHNMDNPYKCDYCEESFLSAQKLARHVTSHAGTRPYPCKLCPRTFILSHHLSRHLKNHYNRKTMENEYGNFKCDFCSMSFRRKDSLINHTAIHSMVNLKCVICNKEFGDAKTVKEHVSTHLASLPYPCDKCDYSFETQEELEDHEVKHVDDEEEEENDYILQDNSLEIVQTYRETELEEDEVRFEDDEIRFDDGEVRPLRRSPRESKIKNYADFLKDELGSDEEVVEELEDDKSEIQKLQIGSIQPVVRSDGIKMYKGKEKSDKNIILNFEQKIEQSNIEPQIQQNQELCKISESRFEINNLAEIEPGQINQSEPIVKTPKSVTKITTLENLGISKQTLDAMTEKSGYVEMKLGQKVIRVQKLMMTKAEYQAMSKKSKLEMKGSTVVVKNLEGGNLDFKNLAQFSKNVPHDQIAETKVEIEPKLDIQVPKTPVKTYIKKTIIKKENLSKEISSSDITKNLPAPTEINIDLISEQIEASDTLNEEQILGLE